MCHGLGWHTWLQWLDYKTIFLCRERQSFLVLVHGGGSETGTFTLRVRFVVWCQEVGGLEYSLLDKGKKNVVSSCLKRSVLREFSINEAAVNQRLGPMPSGGSLVLVLGLVALFGLQPSQHFWWSVGSIWGVKAFHSRQLWNEWWKSPHVVASRNGWLDGWPKVAIRHGKGGARHRKSSILEVWTALPKSKTEGRWFVSSCKYRIECWASPILLEPPLFYLHIIMVYFFPAGQVPGVNGQGSNAGNASTMMQIMSHGLRHTSRTLCIYSDFRNWRKTFDDSSQRDSCNPFKLLGQSSCNLRNFAQSAPHHSLDRALIKDAEAIVLIVFGCYWMMCVFELSRNRNLKSHPGSPQRNPWGEIPDMTGVDILW